MFNENKGFKLFTNGEINGTVRVVLERGTKDKHGDAYLCVFLGKEARKDANLCACVLQELRFHYRKSPTLNKRRVYFVFNFDHDRYGDIVFPAMPGGNSSVVPGEAWF